MTIDEAISMEETTAHMLSDHKEPSEYHRQLAEWLKELKAYREAYPHTAGKTTILKHVGISYDTQTDCPWKRGEEWNS